MNIQEDSSNNKSIESGLIAGYFIQRRDNDQVWACHKRHVQNEVCMSGCMDISMLKHVYMYMCVIPYLQGMNA